MNTKLASFTKISALLCAVLLLSVVATQSNAETLNPSSHDTSNEIVEGYTKENATLSRKTQTRKNTTLRHHDYNQRQFQLFHIDTVLQGDGDHDGFFSSFDLTFDLDVDYGSALVYADIWIKPDYGDYYELLHRTEQFVIEGYYGEDEYHVYAELIDGYPPGYYNILIELYDAEYSATRPVAVADSYTHHALYALPLESRDSSGPALHSSYEVVVGAHAGSLTLTMLLLTGFLALRFRRQLLRQATPFSPLK